MQCAIAANTPKISDFKKLLEFLASIFWNQEDLLVNDNDNNNNNNNNNNIYLTAIELSPGGSGY
jgi:hypothetical protein